MTRLRLKLSALGLIVAMLSATTGVMFAEERHPTCEARQHDCGKAEKISSCCSGDLGTPGDSGTPAQARYDVANGGPVAGPVLPIIQHALPDRSPMVAVQTSPPGQVSLDLPTLFSTFLI